MTREHVQRAVANAPRYTPKVNGAAVGHAQPEVSRGYDAADLVAMDLPDPTYICRPWIAEGVTLLVGRPKVGKTTMLRQLALQANVAGQFFTAPCQSTQVLFLSLEEGERLMRKKLAASDATQEMLRGIRLEFEWPQGAAGVERLREWLQARDTTRLPLIVIDSLTRFRVPPSDKGHQFTEDYNTVKILADLCKEFPGLAIVVLHHTTKAMPDDPVSAISGTYGLSAATENYLIILKQGEQFRLHAGGRLWEGDASDFELTRGGGTWELSGEWDADANQLPPVQRKVLALLRAGAKSNKMLAEETGQTASALSHMLASMAAKSLIVRLANGWEVVR